MLEDLNKTISRKKNQNYSECRDISYHTEAIPVSAGSQGLFVMGLHRCKSYTTQFKQIEVLLWCACCCQHAPIQNLNLSMMKGCVSSQGDGGNCVFAVLIETSVANPLRNAGRQNVAQCWFDSSKRMKMWLQNRLAGPNTGLDDEKVWM